MKRLFVFLIILIPAFGLDSFRLMAQEKDSTDSTQNTPFRFEALIAPAALISFGAAGNGDNKIRTFKYDVRNEIMKDAHRPVSIDDYSIFVPALTVYGLNLAGVKGRNEIGNRTVILVTSYLIMASSVSAVKNLVSELRPDGSNDHSFPSGHTAAAFAGAEFLYQEYRHRSVWYGIAGYAIATGSGYLRMYNDRHWITDVAAGAGIGILSTKIAYWVNPLFQRALFHSTHSQSSLHIIPGYDGKHAGISLGLSF